MQLHLRRQHYRRTRLTMRGDVHIPAKNTERPAKSSVAMRGGMDVFAHLVDRAMYGKTGGGV